MNEFYKFLKRILVTPNIVHIFKFNLIFVLNSIISFRGMAVCISLMIGRIGSVSGSNILGLLIETHCELALYSPAVALIIAGALGFLLPSSNNPVAKPKDLESTS
uniref:Uncharacterized protein n=1 Tax=Bactrocera latifrons TaxID=174628 RepID=A0A0K8VED8_BACLA